MKINLLIIISLVLFSLSCNNKQDSKVSYTPLKTISHNNYSINVFDYEGLKPLLQADNDTVYVFNFWATWCKPCIEELPVFEEFNSNKNSKVKIILISLDFSKNIKTKLIPYIQNNNIESKVILLSDPDSNYWINEINSDWSGAIPATLLVKRGNKVFIEGKINKEELQNNINKLK